MPFTYLDDRYVRKLTGALGPVSVYGPAPGVMPAHLLARAQEGLVDLRYPRIKADADDLPRALKEYKSWVDLHRGDIAAMAAAFKSRQGQPPLVDETNPTAIGDQIRALGRQDQRQQEDPLFRAALFLAMAQEYDQQQDNVAMEQDMLSRLAGEASDRLEEGFGAVTSTGKAVVPIDTGAFMTDRRLQSWAELATREDAPEPYMLFVTPSPSVFENLLDRWPQVRGPWRAVLKIAPTGAGESNPEALDALKDLAFARNEATWRDDLDQADAAAENTADLVVYALIGIRPDQFAGHLLGTGLDTTRTASADNEAANTLIGLMER